MGRRGVGVAGWVGGGCWVGVGGWVVMAGVRGWGGEMGGWEVWWVWWVWWVYGGFGAMRGEVASLGGLIRWSEGLWVSFDGFWCLFCFGLVWFGLATRLDSPWLRAWMDRVVVIVERRGEESGVRWTGRYGRKGLPGGDRAID